MLRRTGQSLSARVSAVAAAAAAVGSGLVCTVAWLFAPGLPWIAGLAGGAIVAAALAGALGYVLVGRRMHRVRSFLERQAEHGDDLHRLPPLGDDEVGRTAAAVNRIFASMTQLRVNVIDQGRELAETQEELRLKEELAAKTGELEQRLRERALLFDILRISASEHELGTVVQELASRLGRELRLRELAIMLRESPASDTSAGAPAGPRPAPQERFAVRATYGFAHPDTVVGRSLAPGEGIAGEVAEAGKPIVVPDVEADSRYLAFWGEVARKGSFAAFPILHGNQLIGIMALTRSPGEPLSDAEIRLLGAIADHVALAIRHARLFDELRELSTHDELTGLANRRLLQSRLEMELDRAHRFEQPLAVVALDIDHFKKLNDRAGHPTGDAALRAVGETMSQTVRRVDTVARIGGEEFVVLLPQATLDHGAAVAEMIRGRIAETDIPGGEGQPGGRLTVSLGVTCAHEDDTPDGLQARADKALYRAKRAGRNRVEQLAPSPAAQEPPKRRPGRIRARGS